MSPLYIGHPQPKITWFKDGQSLAVGDPYKMSADGAFLWIPQANLSNAGHYSCIASNAVGEKTKHTQLSVLGECWAPPTFPPPSYQMLQEGTSNFHKQPLWRSSQISIAMPAGDQAFCTQAFPVTVHVQTVTVPPAGAGKESLGSKKQLDQKPPSPSSSEQEGCG